MDTLRDPRVRYLLVGSACSGLYVALFAAGSLLAPGLHYLGVLAVAQVGTIGVAFPAYRRLVFEASGPWRNDLVRFLGVWCTGAVAGVVGLPLLVELVGLHPVPAQVTAVALVAAGSYLGHRQVSFRPARAPDQAQDAPGPRIRPR